MLGRSMWGHLRLATEWADKTVIPKESVFNILNSELNLFWWISALMAVGLVILVYLAFSMSSSRNYNQNENA